MRMVKILENTECLLFSPSSTSSSTRESPLRSLDILLLPSSLSSLLRLVSAWSSLRRSSPHLRALSSLSSVLLLPSSLSSLFLRVLPRQMHDTDLLQKNMYFDFPDPVCNVEAPRKRQECLWKPHLGLHPSSDCSPLFPQRVVCSPLSPRFFSSP